MDNVINGLEKAKEILFDLEKSIEEVSQIWIELRTLNPDFEEVSEAEWENKSSRFWLHGATKVRECNALEEWLYTHVPLSNTAKSKAIKYYDAWDESIQENESCLDVSAGDIFKPRGTENLHEYILRLAQNVEKNGWVAKKNKRALSAFLSHLRKLKPSEEIAFVEHIFPKEMKLHYNSLIRLIKPQVQPIPQEIAGQILKTFAEEVMRGRANACLKNAEALALCWLCLISSRLRLPITLECIHSMSIESIVIKKGVTYIKMPTIFGPQKVQISVKISKYLQAINNISSPNPRKKFLSSDLHDLRRSLKSAIKKSKISSNFGKITFLTFMTTPHIFGKNIRPGKPVINQSKLSPSMPE
jgi:hypothetical protein